MGNLRPTTLRTSLRILLIFLLCRDAELRHTRTSELLGQRPPPNWNTVNGPVPSTEQIAQSSTQRRGRMVDFNSGLWSLMQRLQMNEFDVESNGLETNFRKYYKHSSNKLTGLRKPSRRESVGTTRLMNETKERKDILLSPFEKPFLDNVPRERPSSLIRIPLHRNDPNSLKKLHSYNSSNKSYDGTTNKQSHEVKIKTNFIYHDHALDVKKIKVANELDYESNSEDVVINPSNIFIKTHPVVLKNDDFAEAEDSQQSNETLVTQVQNINIYTTENETNILSDANTSQINSTLEMSSSEMDDETIYHDYDSTTISTSYNKDYDTLNSIADDESLKFYFNKTLSSNSYESNYEEDDSDYVTNPDANVNSINFATDDEHDENSTPIEFDHKYDDQYSNSNDSTDVLMSNQDELPIDEDNDMNNNLVDSSDLTTFHVNKYQEHVSNSNGIQDPPKVINKKPTHFTPGDIISNALKFARPYLPPTRLWRPDLNPTERPSSPHLQKLFAQIPTEVVNMVSGLPNVFTDDKKKVSLKHLFHKFKHLFKETGKPVPPLDSTQINLKDHHQKVVNITEPSRKLIIVYRPVIFLNQPKGADGAMLLAEGYRPTILTGEEGATVTKEVLENVSSGFLDDISDKFVDQVNKLAESESPGLVVKRIQKPKPQKEEEEEEVETYVVYDEEDDIATDIRIEEKEPVEQSTVPYNDYIDYGGVEHTTDSDAAYFEETVKPPVSPLPIEKLAVNFVEDILPQEFENDTDLNLSQNEPISSIPIRVVTENPSMKFDGLNIPETLINVQTNFVQHWNKNNEETNTLSVQEQVETTKEVLPSESTDDINVYSSEEIKIPLSMNLIKIPTKLHAYDRFPSETTTELIPEATTFHSEGDKLESITDLTLKHEITIPTIHTKFDTIVQEEEIQPIKFGHNLIISEDSHFHIEDQENTLPNFMANLQKVNPGLWWISKPEKGSLNKFILRRIIKRRKKDSLNNRKILNKRKPISFSKNVVPSPSFKTTAMDNDSKSSGTTTSSNTYGTSQTKDLSESSPVTESLYESSHPALVITEDIVNSESKESPIANIDGSALSTVLNSFQDVTISAPEEISPLIETETFPSSRTMNLKQMIKSVYDRAR